MQTTTNYGLKKIELTDSPPDITVMNSNWDTIDAELKEATDHIEESDTHMEDSTIHVTSEDKKMCIRDSDTPWSHHCLHRA